MSSYQPLTESNVAQIRQQVLANQINMQIDMDEGNMDKPSLYYRMLLENTIHVLDFERWSEFIPNTWFHILDKLERSKMSTYYKKLQQKESTYSSVDVGGFVGIFQSQVDEFRQVTDSTEGLPVTNYLVGETRRQTWLKHNMIAPTHVFTGYFTQATPDNTIVLIRIPRETRLRWLTERFGSRWFHKLSNQHQSVTNAQQQRVAQEKLMTEYQDLTEEEKVMQMMMETDTGNNQNNNNNNTTNNFKNSFIAIGSQGRRLPVSRADAVAIRTRKSAEPDLIILVKRICKAFPSSWPKTNFLPLQWFIDKLSIENLEKLTVYDIDNRELVFKPDLLMCGLTV
jgi:hypothetical protein